MSFVFKTSAKRAIKKARSRFRQIGTKNRSKYMKKHDKKIIAKPPGKRVSKSGKVYYERRANRSDILRGYDRPVLKRKKSK